MRREDVLSAKHPIASEVDPTRHLEEHEQKEGGISIRGDGDNEEHRSRDSKEG
jgi:hypothetical protein